MSGSPVLTTISQYPTKAYAGLFLGMDKDLVSFFNNAGTTAGVTDLVFTAVNSATYTATLWGIPISYAADSSATLAEIRAGIIAAAVAVPALVLRGTFAASGNNVRVTELNPELYGDPAISGLDANTTATVVTARSQLEPMPAGIVIARTATGYQDGRLQRASTDHLVGVTTHRHSAISEKAYPSAVYPPKSQLNIAKRGSVWCPTEVQMALNDTVYTRYAVGAGGSQLGAIRNDADTSSARTLAGTASVVQVLSASLALIRFNFAP